MDPVYTFGNKLAKLTGQSEVTCVGLICLAIKDAGKNAKTMGYQDYKEVFQTHFPTRLEKMKIQNGDTLSKELLNYLSQEQSLFTMMVR